MKYITWLSLFIVLFIYLVSCKKHNNDASSIPKEDNIETKTESSNSILGDWELRVIYGGFRASNSSPYYASGNGYIWKFTNSSYQFYSKGHLASNGDYTLTKDTCLATGRFMDALILKQNYNEKVFFEIAKDTLILYRGIIAADGTIGKYVRLPNYR